MSMISEFKDFAMRGNVVDMAVGIVIGGAFGKIVSSFVADVLMPPIGLMLGGVDFSDLALTLKEAVGDTGPVLMSYGVFIQFGQGECPCPVAGIKTPKLNPRELFFKGFGNGERCVSMAKFQNFNNNLGLRSY